jgi:hypothetical protein
LDGFDADVQHKHTDNNSWTAAHDSQGLANCQAQGGLH